MIRTTDQLLQSIAEDLVWRRKELTELRAMVEASTHLRARVLIRCAIALLYAHWEGFIKKASSDYLEYVASARLLNSQLAPNFLALVLRSKFEELSASKSLTSGVALAEFMRSGMGRQSTIPYRRGVDTKSNLSSIVLKEILAALGLDEAVFATRHRFIDVSLVMRRNHVAHGESLSVTVDEYLELHTEVVGLIESFRNQVENAAVLRQFEQAALGP